MAPDASITILERHNSVLPCTEEPLLELACSEIERLRSQGNKEVRFRRFPPGCLALLKTIPGNHRCVDCGQSDPQWAATRFGSLVCLQCSGNHRSLGVQVSTIRSTTMDEWTLTEVMNMLEGGNTQLHEFFHRHALTATSCKRVASNIDASNVTKLRYKTKASLFYRRQMEQHVSQLLAKPYRGRQRRKELCHATSTSE